MSTQQILKWKTEELVLSIDFPKNIDEKNNYPVIVICHGLIGSRIGVDRLFVKAAKHFIENGYICVRFDYKGCGESTGEYGTNTLSDLMDQTKHIVDYVYSSLPTKEVILLGHSLGGAVSLFVAIEDERIKTLIQWAAVGKPAFDLQEIFGVERMKQLKENGVTDFQGYSFYPTYFQGLTNYNPIDSSSNFRGDVLLIHGSKDEDIPYNYVFAYKEQYSKRNTGNVQYKIIKDGNHTFSSVEVFDSLIHSTLSWLQNKKEKKLFLA